MLCICDVVPKKDTNNLFPGSIFSLKNNLSQNEPFPLYTVSLDECDLFREDRKKIIFQFLLTEVLFVSVMSPFHYLYLF